MTQERPNVEAVMSTLKDFQRDSVEYVFDRMYGSHDPTRRFLIADEVGLGKTLVAKGLIAKTIDALWDTTERIDIIYICSSGDIARQNIRRLDITGGEAALPSRVTLLPREIGNLQRNRINFVALTPGTSFNLGSSSGMWQERALMYWMLREAGWSSGGAGAMNVLQGGVQNTDWFRRMIRELPSTYSIDPSLSAAFAAALEIRCASQREAGEADLRSRYYDLSARFKRTRQYLPTEDRADRKRLVGELRSILAASCLEALEPDLVVLDEFQRFKDLLRPDDEAGLLAQRLFEYEQADDHARVVLLSATPYKMYTLAQESESDDHYRDFVDTLRFLLHDEAKLAEVTDILDVYRSGLYRLSSGDGDKLLHVKADLERVLRRVMVRTERLAASSDRDGMLQEIPTPLATLTSGDVRSYVGLREVSDTIGQPDLLEFWKSAPYLLNFMDDYRFKKEFVKATGRPTVERELVAPLSDSPLLLPWKDVAAYRQVDPGNARLRGLFEEVIEAGAWKLLWVPPSMPHYLLEGPYADPQLRRFTKHLVFSSWVMVPRVITCLLSYEAERRMIGSFEQRATNSPQARARRRGLLQFTEAEGRLTGMPVLAMLYPSPTLAELGDPRAIAAEHGTNLSLNEVLAIVRERLGEVLPKVLGTAEEAEGAEDEQWYWAAPILLDRHRDRVATERWFGQGEIAHIWMGADPGSDDAGSGWAEHVEQAQLTAAGALPPGRPPADLADVLALMAVAGPAACALRALRSTTGGRKRDDVVGDQNGAAQIGWTFRTLFNAPETMAVIRGLDQREVPYWRQVLSYCAGGGLQATLDEYAHFLFESLGLPGRGPAEVLKAMAEAMSAPLHLRTPTLRVDDVQVSPEGDITIEKNKGMRGRFALRFGADPIEGSNQITREDQVRAAFNSPFAPFVLATTSVGQEGLDFHAYCHSVVHWNLPSNPVDMEQREGRVHRYKGHAVRKNVASDHGAAALAGSAGDAWGNAFQAARDPERSELVPYWVYPGDAKIERRVPSMPLSRDRERLERLRRSLALYRMVFGQPRQDDLVAFLTTHVAPEEIDRHLNELQIRLEPPTRPALGSAVIARGHP